ncbi:sugar transferase [Asanoa sp. WMMD1127]|uniref:sugar transferase n=1 Tax=Asanoa sp. WMMD1127 TaxID=3016107 RepID=UPI0024159821|nr:sugar transferase [Asanoa sp. WMMD1127]MDG4825200.1 sugar transferase [Asanoa sp. WMMD1127]
MVQFGAPPTGRQETGDAVPRPREPVPVESDRDRPTVVLPYVGTPTSSRTRSLRVWMMSLPVDLLAYLAPLAYTQESWKGVVAGAVATVTLFALGGLYRGRRHISFLDELPTLCGRLLAAAAMVAIVGALRHDSVSAADKLLRTIAVSALLVIVGRLVTRQIAILARRRRWVEHSAIVLGGGPVAIEVARLLRRYPEYGLRFTGFVDVASTEHVLRDSMPLIGHLDDLETLIRLVECDVVLIADIDCTDATLLRIARLPAMLDCDLWMVPRLREFHSDGGIPDHIGAIPVVRVHRSSLSGPRWWVKRASDIVAASIALVVLGPVMLLCALAVLIEGGPGIFFRQQRIGRYGKPFHLVKFRSMRPSTATEAQTTWSIADDPRVGPVGRFLRRTSLDELPQLWNILRGDMTIVGPRPERPFFVDQFSADYPDYAMRHRVPVGLTGLAQVSGLRGDTPISDRARFDNYYIENWSLWLDVKVVIRTLSEVFRARGR